MKTLYVIKRSSKETKVYELEDLSGNLAHETIMNTTSAEFLFGPLPDQVMVKFRITKCRAVKAGQENQK